MNRHYHFRSDYIPPSQAQIRREMDSVAELLSLEMPIAEIARVRGVTNGTVCSLPKRICDGLGRQAQ